VQLSVERHALSTRTHFAGVLRGRERLEALADADLVVYPSEHEVFGLVPLEAILAGTPVIVGDDCGCGEIVGQTGGGQVVRAGDVTALAATIRGMLHDRDRWRRTIVEAAARIRAAYDGHTVGAALADLYRSLITR
jgi:glycosyltransferase involved in cell wall biosynthesis